MAGSAGAAGTAASLAISYRAAISGDPIARCGDDESVIGAVLVCPNGTALIDDPNRAGKKVAQCIGGALITQGTMICAK